MLFSLIAFILPLFVFTACAMTAPLPSKASFSEQVLEPLAEKRTNEIMDQWQANLRLYLTQHPPPQSGSGALGTLFFIGGWIWPFSKELDKFWRDCLNSRTCLNSSSTSASLLKALPYSRVNADGSKKNCLISLKVGSK